MVWGAGGCGVTEIVGGASTGAAIGAGGGGGRWFMDIVGGPGD